MCVNNTVALWCEDLPFIALPSCVCVCVAHEAVILGGVHRPLPRSAGSCDRYSFSLQSSRDSFRRLWRVLAYMSVSDQERQVVYLRCNHQSKDEILDIAKMSEVDHGWLLLGHSHCDADSVVLLSLVLNLLGLALFRLGTLTNKNNRESNPNHKTCRWNAWSYVSILAENFIWLWVYSLKWASVVFFFLIKRESFLLFLN